MEMITLTQLARKTDLAPPTIYRYLDDFTRYLPAVRVGQTIAFPAEIATVIERIHAMTEEGRTRAEIASVLDAAYPTDAAYLQSARETDSGTGPLATLPGDLAQIRKVARMLARRIEDLQADMAELRAERGEMRALIADLQESFPALRQERTGSPVLDSVSASPLVSRKGRANGSGAGNGHGTNQSAKR
jgi:AcrR family transcriptional regulator